MDLGAHLDPVAIGQPDVEHHHVRTEVSREREGFAPCTRLTDDVEVVLRFEERPETFSDESVIVRDQDLDPHRPRSRV